MGLAIVEMQKEAALRRKHAVRLLHPRPQKPDEVIEAVFIPALAQPFRAICPAAKADAVARFVAHRLQPKPRLPPACVEGGIDVDQIGRTGLHPSQRGQIVAMQNSACDTRPPRSHPIAHLQTRVTSLASCLDTAASKSIVGLDSSLAAPPAPGATMANAAALKTSNPDALPPIHSAGASSVSAFSYAMLSHPGRVRRANQDACAAAPEDSAFVVCDGVGGAAGGEVASQLAVESFLGAIRHSGHAAPDDSHPSARLHQAVLAANAAVFQRAQKQRNLRGMATTLVAALLEHPESGRVAYSRTVSSRGSGEEESSLAMSGEEDCPTLWLAHAGDSRAYLLRRGANGDPADLRQLTSDHSLVEEQVRAGLVSRIEAAHSPVRNVITRAVGAAPAVEPEIASHAIQPGDLYLLASDGLTRELDDAEIAEILTATLGLDYTAGPALKSTAPISTALEAAAHALGTFPPLSHTALESAASALIDAANHHGGRDNITVLLLACR